MHNTALAPIAFPRTADTGNSCYHPGYDEFNPPSWPGKCAPNKEDWITLDPGMCGDGDSYPEEFWNCADIAITSSGELLVMGYNAAEPCRSVLGICR